MAGKSFSVASWTKLSAIFFILQLLLAVVSSDENILKPMSGEGPAANNPLLSWVNLEMQNLADNQMKAASSGGGKDPKLQEAEKKRTVIKVAADGSGDFKTITDAVKSVPSGNTDRTIIKIKGGTYNEKVLIEKTKPFITLVGDGSKPTIVFDGTAAKYGTFYSATVCVMSDYFVASNIIFKNSAPKPPPGSQGGQAVALRIAGDKAAFYKCDFIGFQDTLHDDTGNHYFENCQIQGTVDFIFGDGRSLYKGCTVTSVADPKGISALIAQGREGSSDQGGFSFVNCKVTGSGKADLNRAWRSYSRVIFANCFLDSVVSPEGWADHGLSEKNLFYGEYKCTGPGASSSDRVSYAMKLTEEQAKPFMDISFIQGSSWLLSPPS